MSRRRPETGPRGTMLGWVLIHLVPTAYAVVHIAGNR